LPSQRSPPVFHVSAASCQPPLPTAHLGQGRLSLFTPLTCAEVPFFLIRCRTSVAVEYSPFQSNATSCRIKVKRCEVFLRSACAHPEGSYLLLFFFALRYSHQSANEPGNGWGFRFPCDQSPAVVGSFVRCSMWSRQQSVIGSPLPSVFVVVIVSSSSGIARDQ